MKYRDIPIIFVDTIKREHWECYVKKCNQTITRDTINEIKDEIDSYLDKDMEFVKQSVYVLVPASGEFFSGDLDAISNSLTHLKRNSKQCLLKMVKRT